jgi:hypothetical protein
MGSLSVPATRDIKLDPAGDFLYLADHSNGVRGYKVSAAVP